MANKKKARVLSPTVLLTYLMVITFIMTGLSFARFGETKTADDAARAAIFEVTVPEVQSDKDIELYIDDDNGTQVRANYTFKVKSVSEVPVTYDVTVEAPADNDTFPFGLQVYLTPIDTDTTNNPDYATEVADAKAGIRASGTHYHNSQPLDGANPSKKFNFIGCGIAPAGTYTQEYVLNFHYKLGTDSHDITSTDYSRTGMKFNNMEGVKISITARDGRNNAHPNHSTTVSPSYTTPYTPAE